MGESKTVQENKLPEWQTKFLQGTVLPVATEIAGSTVSPYGGQFAPGMSQYSTQAAQGLGGILNRTPQDYAAATAANMNPYQQQVIDAGLAQMDRARQQAITQDEARIIGSGAFDNSRRGVYEGERAAGYGAARDQLIANLLQQGYGQAQAQTMAQQAAQAGAAGGLLQAGGAETALGLAGNQAAYNEWLRQQNYPFQKLQGILGFGGGNYGGTQTQTEKKGLLDYLAAGASIFGAL